MARSDAEALAQAEVLADCSFDAAVAALDFAVETGQAAVVIERLQKSVSAARGAALAAHEARRYG